jgi:hypothetical protein
VSAVITEPHWTLGLLAKADAGAAPIHATSAIETAAAIRLVFMVALLLSLS